MRAFLASVVVIAVAACGGSTVTIDGGVDGSTDDAGGLPPSTFACNAPGECDIRPQSCCGSCSTPTPSDMIAINWQKAAIYTYVVCNGNGCPACFTEPDHNLAPVCRGSVCKAVDVRVDGPLSACKTDLDCRLRFSGCCEPCGSQSPSTLIALSTSGAAEYAANQCHPDVSGCAKCAVQYPADYAARCNPSTLHCEVVHVALDAGGGG